MDVANETYTTHPIIEKVSIEAQREEIMRSTAPIQEPTRVTEEEQELVDPHKIIGEILGIPFFATQEGQVDEEHDETKVKFLSHPCIQLLLEK